jgi:hypothetical protein
VGPWVESAEMRLSHYLMLLEYTEIADLIVYSYTKFHFQIRGLSMGEIEHGNLTAAARLGLGLVAHPRASTTTPAYSTIGGTQAPPLETLSAVVPYQA